jgi:hypothetical protein
MTGNVQECAKSHGAADGFSRFAGETAVIDWHDLAYGHRSRE